MSFEQLARRSASVAGLASLALVLQPALRSAAIRAQTAPPATVPAADTVAAPRPDSATRRARRETALPAVRVRAAAARGTSYAAGASLSAMKTDTPLRETPQTVTVVTRALIADQAMQSMADAVRYVPSIGMGQGEGHRDAPTIRGNSSTADFFVDGVRDDAQYLRDLYNVERVEVLEGSNAMIFGRGGGGGVINRVTKAADFAPTRQMTIEGGSFDHRRATLDAGQGLTGALAGRVNAMYEESGAFRDQVSLRRYGINPTAALSLGARTTARLGYELFQDHRTVDRGIPSFEGRPSPAPLTVFFGNPDVNFAEARVNAASASVEHTTARGVKLRSRTRFADYDKFYQNSFPGDVSASGTAVNLSAYNHRTDRRNIFNQTELTGGVATGSVTHTLLVGVEAGRQRSEQVRATGYFGDSVKTLTVPFASPTIGMPIVFRQSATDADNHTLANVAAAYVQDQIVLSPRWQVVGGVRYERFGVRYVNHRTPETLRRDDDLLSPRLGVIFEPAPPLSLYASYGRSYLPSAGDQFSSLSVTTEMLDPERFTNVEVGAKWDVRPDLALTTAVYRLDRTNTSAPDPRDPANVIQTGSQRTSGFELGVTGSITPAWQVAGGFSAQRAIVTSTTTRADAGATVPLVPGRSFSLWNRYQLFRPLGAGLGIIHRAKSYAAIDNTVTLPGFTRLDGALFVSVSSQLRLQLNVENLLGGSYYWTSQGNNNIMPGAPRTLRVGVIVGK